MKTILSTKILKPELISLFHSNQYKVLQHDFIHINPIALKIDLEVKNIIITSKNALFALEKFNPKKFKIFCVGFNTKKILESKGFIVLECAYNAKELSKIIIDKYNKLDFIYLCSSIRRDFLPDTLKNNAISYKEIIVYATTLTSIEIKDTIDIILFYSPSGVESYLLNNKITNELCYCIGETTANTLQEITKKIVVLKSATIENMIFEIIKNN